MSNAYTELLAAMNKFNAAERAELREEHGLVWLGETGPAYISGDVRFRALFAGPDGSHWTDAHLVVESAYLGHPAFDWASDLPGSTMEPGHDLWVCTPERGRHNAIIVPITEILGQLDMPDAKPFPADNWTRSWRTLPTIKDRMALGLVDHGVPV